MRNDQLPVEHDEDEQECGFLYDHDASPGDSECRECGADLTLEDWE